MTVHRFALGDGAAIYVEDDGDPALPALVLANGAFCTVRQWDLVVPALSEHFRVVRHDVRGTGQSGPGPDDQYRFEQYADDVVALCARLGVEEFSLWGMAWGARLALVTAARHSSRVGRVVLSDLAIDPGDNDAQKAGAAVARHARHVAGITEVDPPEGWNQHNDLPETIRSLGATREHPDLMPFVEKVRAPTLIVTGEHDPNLTSSERALPGFAHAEMKVLPHAAHGSVLQRPYVLVEMALNFLTA